MLDLKILKLMFKEEFRLQASFFNRSYFIASSFAIILFTLILGLSLPMLRRVVAVDDMLLVSHWILLFYGLAVGGFALFGERIMERRFGSISLLLGSGYTLPIRFRRLFLIFYIKDSLYYVFFTILPLVGGLAIASLFVSISLMSLAFLFVSLTLSFLAGISLSVLLFTAMGRWRTASLLVISIAILYIGFSGIDIRNAAAGLPSLAFYKTRSLSIMLGMLAAAVVLAIISSLLVKEISMPHERRAREIFRKTVRLTTQFVSSYGPMLSKDIIDLVRSGMIIPVVTTFLMPLLFLYAVTWFIGSVMLLKLGFSLLFYAAMVGFFCTLLYSWLSNIDISECYNSLPLSMSHVIRTKLILFLGFTGVVAIPYLLVIGYLKGELQLLWLGLFIMFSVSAYMGSVLAYLTGLFTNSYLLDAKILLQFAIAVVPALVVETVLSFYYPINNIISTYFIVGLGLLLAAGSIIFLKKLDSRWKGKMFRIA